MDLAAKGDHKKLDVTRSSMWDGKTPKNIADDNPYQKFRHMETGDDEMVFSLGRAMFKKLGESLLMFY